MKKFYNVLSCPFCGTLPTIQYWHGGSPSKRRLACESTTCAVSPSVTGSNGDRAVAKWNSRAMPATVGTIYTKPRD